MNRCFVFVHMMSLCLTIAFGSGLMAGAAEDAGQRWNGVFEPRRKALLSAEISQRVTRVPIRPGQACRTGEVLMEFDSSHPEAAVSAFTTKLEAQEMLRESSQNLFERRQATPLELARAQSEYAQAELELANARRDLAACRVTAPFDGKVVDLRVDEHEWATRGNPLLLLVDDAVLQVRFFLPEEMFARIRPGDPVRVYVPAVSASAPGTVSRIGVVFDPASRSFDVWADVDNASDTLRAGMTVSVEWPVLENEFPGSEP